MRKLFYCCFLLLFINSCSTNKVSTHQKATSKHGIVAAAHPLAAQAGKEMLNLGGNAIDAAVASAFALSVVEPSMSGIGGRLQAIIRLPNGEIKGIDATSQSPMAFDTALIKPEKYGYTTIGVPGVVAGLTKMQEEYGSLPLQTVIAPAIRYAEKGFELLPGEAIRHQMALQQLQEFEGSKSYFLKEGKTYEVGSLLVQQDLAAVLKKIAKEGKKGFYEGEIAEKIVADIQANGGSLQIEDLKNYEALSSKIVTGSYRGYELNGLWLPSYGAITIEILQILENFPMDQMDEATRLKTIFLAMQLAYEDRNIQKKDESMAEELTSKAYAKRQAERIKTNKIPEKTSKTPTSSYDDGHTTHLSTADDSGMMVALTQSLGPNMGSKVATPGLGFLYAVSLGSYLGIYEPQQRVSSHISPMIVTGNGQPYLALGAAGGSRIVTAIVQAILQVIDEKLPLDQALAAYRIHPNKDTILLEVHEGIAIEPSIIKELKAANIPIEIINKKGRFGRVHAVLFDGQSKWTGAADPDWEGAVAIEK